MTRAGAVGLALGIAGLLAALAGALGYRTRIMPLGPAFLIFGAGLLAALLAAAVSAISMILILARGERPLDLARGWPEQGIGRPALGLIMSLAVLAVPIGVFLSNRGRGIPSIHDITTDTDAPPVYVDVLPLRAGAPNPVAYGGPDIAAQQQRAYPDIVPLTVPSSPDQVFDHALVAVNEMGWELAGSNREEGRIEATDTTFWFGFKDDVVVRIRPAEGGSRVDVRSLSRVGGGDIGTNARRIRAFVARLSR